MIARLPNTNNNPRIQGHPIADSDDIRVACYLQNKRIAERARIPTVLKIHFHTFSRWKTTKEQHRTKDPWHVKMLLGHKSITSTETYIHLEKMIYDGETNDQFITKVAHNVDEAIKLTDIGFEEVTGEYNGGGKIFKKRK